MPTSNVAHDRDFEHLDAAECWRLVGDHGIGRVVFEGDTWTHVVPTTYDAVNGTAYFRSRRSESLHDESMAGPFPCRSTTSIAAPSPGGRC